MNPEIQSAPEEGFLRKILQKKHDNTDQNAVFGASVMEYQLYYVSGSAYYDGTISFQNGVTQNVSGVPFDEAEEKKVRDIYTYSTNIYAERVLNPRCILYREDIRKHIICYNRFDQSLKDFLPSLIHKVKDQYGLPEMVIRTQISKLLKSVDSIHNSGRLHLSLDDISNYVVINNNWYIINAGGNLTPSNKQQMIVKDFQNFGNMLAKNVLLDTSWQESNDFLKTFAINVPPKRFVHILLDNVFTKSSYDRLQMFSTIHHGLRSRSATHLMLRNAISNGVFNGYIINGGWNNVPMGTVLSQVYQFNNSNYNGQNIWSLLNFCRNVFEHYYRHHNGDVNVIEEEIRRLWPGFLEKLLYYY